MTAGRPEKVGALSPGVMTLLNLPAKAGLATRARQARLRSSLRIGANSSGILGETGSRTIGFPEPHVFPGGDPSHPRGPLPPTVSPLRSREDGGSRRVRERR